MFFCFIPQCCVCENECVSVCACVDSISDVEISLKWLNWVIWVKLQSRYELCSRSKYLGWQYLPAKDPNISLNLTQIFQKTLSSVETRLLGFMVEEVSDTFFPPTTFCFSPRRALILWALCLFPNIYTLFLKLKSQSQRFQLEKCGASECIHFNSREWSPECCRRVLLEVLLCL